MGGHTGVGCIVIDVGGDTGAPVVLRPGEGEPFLELARNVAARAEEAAREEGPRIEVSD